MSPLRHCVSEDGKFGIHPLYKKGNPDEFRIPDFPAFAFGTVEKNTLWTAFEEQGVHRQLITLLRQVYTSAKATVKVGEALFPIGVERGGDKETHLHLDCLSLHFKRFLKKSAETTMGTT
ncbi:unnamed protein product [Cylicostephanus goldi]|uniref:Uncharacterized protein n=1 Tax=Cylicostephanus goldi TaxID=71465 RepID=A0A3P7LX07_CYLGO|nr:unnamed protein product [Cylicostephanus goldi]